MNLAQLEATAQQWNKQQPIGSRVQVWSQAGCVYSFVTSTRSTAYVRGDRVLVDVNGMTKPVPLTSVVPVSA